MDKNKIVKFKPFFVDIEKEEAFIEKYREKGYRIESLNNNLFKYVFRKTENTFIPKVKIDYRPINGKEEYENYLSMFEDSGWKHIHGTYWGGVHYFEQMNENTADEIFSDRSSLASMYRRLLVYSVLSLLPSITMLCACLINYDLGLLFHPKNMYFTPGLWDMNGMQFWRAFLFETPFVFLRNGFLLILPVMIIIFGFCCIKSIVKARQYSN